MVESEAYRHIRRQLLAGNPYFQSDLTKLRLRLEIPPIGFADAICQLEQGLDRDATGFHLGRPDLIKLINKAQSLGLPLKFRLEEWRERDAQLGLDFYRTLEEQGWSALPIFLPMEWANWWTDYERIKAGLDPYHFDMQKWQRGHSDSLPDSRQPSTRAALWLARRYHLGDDFAINLLGMILGVSSGGGQADIVIVPRKDGAGLTVTLNCIRDDTTVADWLAIYKDTIEPALLSRAGAISDGKPFIEALEEARRRNRPGRPPYTAETLNKRIRMWEFCYENSCISGGLGESIFHRFLNELPPDERSAYEEVDLETFRRAVKRLDQLLRPTESQPDFFP